MSWVLSHPLQAAGIALILILILSYILSSSFRFLIFDTWMDFPLFGRIPLTLSRMRRPTAPKANLRLDKVFRGYRKHIKEPPLEDLFNQAISYLSLCGDAGIKRHPAILFIPLLLLLTAEAYGFSFLLAFALAPDSSEEFASLFSVGVALLVACLLAYWGHKAGHSYHRAREIKMAEREAIDPSQDWPEKEKSIADLTRLVSLSENQERDQPNLSAFNSQRLLNRAKRTDTDDPSYWPAIIFWLIVIGLSVLQFKMRMEHNAALAASTALMDSLNAALVSEASGEAVANHSSIAARANDAVTSLANIFLIVIFVATQAIAFWIGYRHTLLGPQSLDALKRTGGRTSYAEFRDEFEAKASRADESLNSLLTKFQIRFPGITPDKALYFERLHRAKADEAKFREGNPPSPDQPGATTDHPDNISPFFKGTGGGK